MGNYLVHNDKVYFHPGYILEEEIEYSGLNQREFAAKLGTSTKTLSKIVNGEQGITADLAKKLNAVTGTKGQFWMNLQNTYDYSIVELKSKDKLEKEKEIVRKLEYSYFTEFFELPAYQRQLDKQIQELHNFIKIPDLSVLENKDTLVCFRKKELNIEDNAVIKCNALLYVAQNFAAKQVVDKWNKNNLSKALEQIATFSLDSENYREKVESCLNKNGIAFICLPHMKGSGLNGATKKFGKNMLVVITDRGKSYDTFWFTLFHELYHLINGDYGVDLEMKNATKKELDADEFAANCLVDKVKYFEFKKIGDFSKKAICKFAEGINRHPSIVAGRLCYDGLLPYKSKVATALRYV